MSITCPRCKHATTPRTATPRPGARPVTADLCPGCGGIWFDGAELAHVVPGLETLPPGAPGVDPGGEDRPVLGCPRCAGRMAQMVVLGVTVDICLGCHGAWLDGGEYEALSRGVDRAEGLDAPPAADGRERSEAGKAASTGLVRCASCTAEVDLDATYYTDRGLVCPTCWSSEQDEMKRRAADPEIEKQMKQGAGALSYFAEGAGLVLKNLGIAVLFAGAALGGGRCSRCGCRSSSHCHH